MMGIDEKGHNVDAIRRLGEYTKVEQIRDEALQIQDVAGSLRPESFDMYGVISFLLNENKEYLSGLKNVVKEVAFDKRRHVWRAGGRSQSELST